jgi:hypothetical protein
MRDRVCFHPNAANLNGSEQELMEADGTNADGILYSTRMQVLKADEDSYVTTRFGPKNHELERVEIDNTVVVHGP